MAAHETTALVLVVEMEGFMLRAILIGGIVLLGCASSAFAGGDHLGQRASAHVVLEVAGGWDGGCGVAELDFSRTLSNGTSDMVNVNSVGAFRVPAGKALVVTDVDWQYVHPNGAAAAGTVQTLRLFIENLATPDDGLRAFESAITLSTTGAGGASEHMTSGFVVSSSARICPDVSPGPDGPPFGLQHLIVRGYLVADK